ncbi:sulfatase [Haloarchaeobius litoreus]|uniref:Sulfatase n=1 Tax=Haloarchaeobius litoreus TaxID=755306 RepID=A0ABD6DKV2_9EURY|nr:sulfatase [Haloarchaeobius litoreus]
MNPTAGQNVLFVVMDTVRKDHLSVYGYDRPTTPGLEAFASEAAVYEGAVAQAPWTLPVHASLFTGLYPSQHGASQENPYLEGATTLAETLSDTHRTACYSSNAWITPYTHLTDGFDDQDNFFEVMPGEFLSGPIARAWKAMNDSPTLRRVADWMVSVGNTIHEYTASGEGADSKTPQVVDRTQEFVAEAEADGENWFQFINLMDAHLPYHPPEEYRAEFAPGVDSTAVCQNSKEYNSGARDIDADEWADIQGLYDAEIRHIDAELTRLFDWLQADGLWEDTLVVVCADHGELFGEHGLYGHEFCIYDPLVNVPCMVKHPDLDPGRYDRQFELLDLYHTVLDHADVENAGGDGVDLDPTRSLLDDAHGDREGGEYAFVEYSRPVVELKQLEGKAADAGIELDEDSRFYSRMRAARRTDGKYIRNERIPDEFYRVDEDPGETDDRLGEGDPVEAEVESALDAFEERVADEWDGGPSTDASDGELDEMSDTAKERLQDLGYME